MQWQCRTSRTSGNAKEQKYNHTAVLAVLGVLKEC